MKKVLFIAATLFTVCLLANVAQADTKHCRSYAFGSGSGASTMLLDQDLEENCTGKSCSVEYLDEKIQARYSYGASGSSIELTDRISGQTSLSYVDVKEIKKANAVTSSAILKNEKTGLLGNQLITTITFGCDLKSRKILK